MFRPAFDGQVCSLGYEVIDWLLEYTCRGPGDAEGDPLTLDDEVSIKVGLEVSSIVKEITGPSNSLAYQVGTRSASTSLRLKNGETQVLAGLISDEERKATSHLPGLGEIPVLGRAFGSHKDTSTKTEIILLITPRIVRNIHRPDYAQPTIASGTEAAVGAVLLTVRSQGGRTLSMSGQGGVGTSPATTQANAGENEAPPEADDPPIQVGQQNTAPKTE